MSRASQLLRLILADLWHDRIAVACQALALAAVVVPLMVLLGLRAGVIGTMIERMDRDPAMRLVLPEVTGGNRFDEAWLDRWRADPRVAFVLPNTRAIAAQVDLVSASGATLRVALNPTAPGDPIGSGEAVTGPDALAVTSEAARRLDLTEGDTVTVVLERTRGGRIEPASRRMAVAAVLAPERASGSGAYVTLPLLLAIQAYRDGYAVPELGGVGDGPAPAVSAHPLFRLYARSIRDVGAVAEALRREGVQVVTREGEIESTLRLDASLRAVLGIIAAAAATGAGLSLLAGQLASLERKRRDLAVLKLIGYGPGWLVALPIGLGLAVGLLGALLAVPLFAVTAAAINGFFAASLAPGEAACRLSAGEIAALVGATMLVALPSGLIVARRAARVDPSEEVRDV